MRRRMLASAVLAPAAILASAGPALAAPTHTGPARTNDVIVKYVGATAPLHALRSSTQSCSGTLVYSQKAAVAGKPVAELDVYAKPGNGGTIVACTKHLGAAKGLRTLTGVSVAGSPSAKAKTGVAVVAEGNYVSYAGPAAIGGVKGKCFQAAGLIRVGGKVIDIIMAAPVCAK